MNRSNSYNIWIAKGYELLAQEGPEGLQVERLARILDLNKSGFYHYFGNQEVYFQHLMQHHLKNVGIMMESVRSMSQFMPGFAQLLADFSISILVQKQLQRSGHLLHFGKAYDELNQKIDPTVLSLWANFLEIPDNPTLAQRYLAFVRDLFYARISPTTLTFEFISDFFIEAKEICTGFRDSYRTLHIDKKSA